MSPFWKRIRAIILHHVFYTTRRNPYRWGEMMFWPLWELLIWGFFSAYFQKITNIELELSLQLFTGSLFLWNMIRRIQEDFVASITTDFDNRNLKNLLITPLSLFELTLGTGLATIIKYLASMLFFAVVALLLLKFNLAVFLIKILPFLFNFIFFGFILALLGFGLVLGFGKKIMFVPFLISAIVQPVSCIFYSCDVLPPFLQMMTRVLPSARLFESVRVFLLTGQTDHAALFMTFLLNCLFFAISLQFVRWMYHRGLKKALFIRV